MKQTTLFLLTLLFTWTAAAQVDQSAFDRQKQQMRERFEQQKGKAKQQYDDVRRERSEQPAKPGNTGIVCSLQQKTNSSRS